MSVELAPITFAETSTERYNGPPAELISHPIVSQAVAEYVKARAEAHAARQDVTELEHQLPNAEQADRDALADALAAGRRDPGAKHADAHRAKIEQARRVADAHKLIADRKLTDLQAAFDHHQDEWHEQADAQVTRLEAERLAALKQLISTDNRLQQARAVRSYARGRGQFRSAAGDVLNVQRNGDTSVGQLLDMLLDHAKQPWPKTPRRPRPTGGPMIASHG